MTMDEITKLVDDFGRVSAVEGDADLPHSEVWIESRAALLRAVEGIVRERDRAESALVARHGGEPLALLAELDEARGALKAAEWQSYSGHEWNRLLNERDAFRVRAEAAEKERDLYRRQVEVRYGKAEEQIERLTLERDAALTALRNGSTIQADAVARIVDKDRDRWRDLVRLAEQERNEAVNRAERLLSERDAANETAQRIAERLAAAESALAAKEAEWSAVCLGWNEEVEKLESALAAMRKAHPDAMMEAARIAWAFCHEAQQRLIADDDFRTRAAVAFSMLDRALASPPPAALSTETGTAPAENVRAACGHITADRGAHPLRCDVCAPTLTKSKEDPTP